MIGQLISHYRIIEQLGAGGMGVVYKAEDTKLKRTVALKFLPPELTRDPEAKQRFIREAQAASALEHPNICNIHEIDETAEGQLFIVMACYEGETLKDKIKDKRLKTKDAIQIAMKIAEGMARAHEEGIVHRDIKPANIIITDRDEVKILDFGLAKLVGKVQLTKDTSTLGTVAYMSPEQVSGKEVDHCTDIWSLGVVLYEMLTGERPFKGDYEQAVIYAILNEEPEQTDNIQPELQGILKKAFYKNPDKRYSSITELLNDLTNVRENFEINKFKHKSIKTKNTKSRIIIISSVIIFILIAIIASYLFFPTSESEESIKSLAVLPFSNIKPDPNTDYLGLAFAAEIISDMSYFKNITIRPFSSVREIQSKEQLNVDYVLTGSFIKLEDRINLNMEFFELKTEKILWQESLNRPFEESHVLLSDVSEKVINGLKIQFSQEERVRMQSDRPKNPKAYEFYLRSLDYSSSQKDNMLAIEMLNRSIELDSTYAPAFFRLGYRLIQLAQDAFGWQQLYDKAQQNLHKALELNPNNLDVLNFLAKDYADRGNFDQAFSLVDKALKINSNYAHTHYRISYIYRYTGMLKESEKAAQKALKLDPANKIFRSIGHSYLYLGNYQKAYETYELDKGTPWTLTKQSGALIRQKKYKKALECINKVLEKESSGQRALEVKARKAYFEGNIELGIIYTQQWEEEAIWDAEMWYQIAANYGLLGDNKGCVRVLRKAIKGGFVCYPFFLIDPFLDPVREDPEFHEVLALAKEKHEAFKTKYFPEEL